MAEWIDVNERLPDKIANYLVHYIHSYSTDDGYWAMGITFYNGSRFNWCDNSYRITHWMPLPEPPEQIKERFYQEKERGYGYKQSGTTKGI